MNSTRPSIGSTFSAVWLALSLSGCAGLEPEEIAAQDDELYDMSGERADWWDPRDWFREDACITKIEVYKYEVPGTTVSDGEVSRTFDLNWSPQVYMYTSEDGDHELVRTESAAIGQCDSPSGPLTGSCATEGLADWVSGNRHTPEGWFTLSGIRESTSGFNYFWHFTGADVGLHGAHDLWNTLAFDSFALSSYWTAGCVAISDHEIESLYDGVQERGCPSSIPIVIYGATNRSSGRTALRAHFSESVVEDIMEQ